MDKMMRPTDDGRLHEEHESKMKRAISVPDEQRRAEQAAESSRQSRENL